MPKYRTFSPKFKADVVLQVLSGARSAAEICRQHKLSEAVFYRWKADFLAHAERVFQTEPQAAAEARIAELERLVGRLALELEVTKKVSSLLDAHSSRNGTSP